MRLYVRRLAQIGALLALSLLVFTGCSERMVGKGLLHISDGWPGQDEQAQTSQPAAFSLRFDGPRDTISGMYVDRASGVQLMFTDLVSFAGPDGYQGSDDDDCMGAAIEYMSLNRQNRGTGTLQLNACDEGAPGYMNGDTVDMLIIDGPFAGYIVHGMVTGDVRNLDR